MDIRQTSITLLLLLTAAVLEAGGDGVIRAGLRTSTPVTRILLFVAGGAFLFVYAYLVNSQPWDFGRLLGTYIVFFFVVAQLISWLVFHERPAAGLMIGGAFIVTGGIIISCTSR